MKDSYFMKIMNYALIKTFMKKRFQIKKGMGTFTYQPWLNLLDI